MTVTPLIPDAPIGGAAPAPAPAGSDADDFGAIVQSFTGTGDALIKATNAETAFANGAGSLQDMVFERARADALLSEATAIASRASQALTTILSMQI